MSHTIKDDKKPVNAIPPQIFHRRFRIAQTKLPVKLDKQVRLDRTEERIVPDNQSLPFCIKTIQGLMISDQR